MAKFLYSKGLRTVQDLYDHQDLLNKNQIIGLICYKDFQLKIPRLEVEMIRDRVWQCVETIAQPNDRYLMEVCGSYRRGKLECGDIDILITNQAKNTFDNAFLGHLITELTKANILTYHL